MKSPSQDLRVFISQYKEKQNTYIDFANVLSEIIKSILENEGISYQAISARAKTIESLRDKIKRKRVQEIFYKKLEDVTDLAGVRIILYFKDDIDKVLEIVDREFKLITDPANHTVVKSPHGYIAYHRIVTLTKKRSNLNEYKRFKKMHAEIQVKTIMQHAWAEIEHDIGYKPRVKEEELERKNIRQRLVKNASLIEKADDNFVQIRKLHSDLLEQYQKDVDKKNLEILLNYDSVSTFLRKKYKDKIIRKQQILDILNQAERKKLKDLSDLSKAIDANEIRFTFED